MTKCCINYDCYFRVWKLIHKREHCLVKLLQAWFCSTFGRQIRTVNYNVSERFNHISIQPRSASY